MQCPTGHDSSLKPTGGNVEQGVSGTAGLFAVPCTILQNRLVLALWVAIQETRVRVGLDVTKNELTIKRENHLPSPNFTSPRARGMEQQNKALRMQGFGTLGTRSGLWPFLKHRAPA